MRDIISKNHILDGEIIDSDNILGFNDAATTVIYEVIRVINRVGVFIEDHLQRLDESLRKADIKKSNYIKDIDKHIKQLGETNNVDNFNVKLMIMKDEAGESHYVIYIMTSFYPDIEMIKSGIHVELMEWERANPNTKIVNSNFKDTVASLMEKYNAFELLLLNKEGFITEGSRTNVFFVSGDELITAPSDYILKGITRKYVLSACEKAGLKVVEKLLHKDMVSSIDGAFVCGTSLKVLPINSVGNIKISSSSNRLVQLILKEYDEIMNQYINNYIKG